jgi:hypothetical protein
MLYPDEHDERVDEAVRARLSQLKSMPVDVTNFERKLAASLPPRPRQKKERTAWLLHQFALRPLRAVAASFILAFAVAAIVLLSTSSGPALADVSQLARVHEEIVSGKVPVKQVTSIDAANRILREEHPGTPALPQMPDSHVMACCMKSVQNKKMACVLLKNEGIPVTLAVASASDMKMAMGEVKTRANIEYRVQKTGNLSMVMTERNGKWLCLIGEMSAESLMDMASEIQF